MIDERALNLLEKLLDVFKGKKIKFAIGGGIAVNIYGVERNTCDVDAYFCIDEKEKVMKALYNAGFIVDRVFPPFHYIAFLPEHLDLRVRIDIFFPQDEPEISAVEKPKIIKKWGKEIPVFSVEFLILSKFYSNQPLDNWDIAALYSIGAFEPEAVKFLLSRIDKNLLPEFDSLIQEIKQKEKEGRRRKPPGRR